MKKTCVIQTIKPYPATKMTERRGNRMTVRKTKTAAETAMKKKFDELLIEEGFKKE